METKKKRLENRNIYKLLIYGVRRRNMGFVILRVANDALPDESLAVGKIANNADADRGFSEQK